MLTIVPYQLSSPAPAAVDHTIAAFRKRPIACKGNTSFRTAACLRLPQLFRARRAAATWCTTPMRRHSRYFLLFAA